MRLAKAIYNEQGLVLLNRGSELTAGILTRLSQLGIRHLYIEDPRTDDLVIPELITDDTRRESIQTIRTQFSRLMDDAGKRRTAGQHELGKSFRSVMNNIVDDLKSHPDALIMLSDISIMDHYLYQHSLNVCIYTVLMGIASGYDRETLMTIGLGAMLHDIGKTQIPVDLLYKQGKLSDEEYRYVQQHAEFGFRILKDEANIPLLAAHCAYQHHERMNGSGYPRGLSDEQIHEFARWLGIIDSYEAMTSARVYRDAMLPHQAMEILFAGAESLFDIEKLRMFRDRVALYPIGSEVRLSTGEYGVVVDINAKLPSRPIVRILGDESGDIAEAYELDLSKKLNIIVVELNNVRLEDGAKEA